MSKYYELDPKIYDDNFIIQKNKEEKIDIVFDNKRLYDLTIPKEELEKALGSKYFRIVSGTRTYIINSDKINYIIEE